MKSPMVLVFGCLPLLCLAGAARASAQTPRAGILEPTSDTTAAAQTCAALSQINFEGVPDAPAKITSARLLDVTSGEFENAFWMSSAPARSRRVKQYCRVNGYVAPQNKFELRLPLPSDWNQSFFFSACAGLCGATNGAACNAGLAREYASVTGNGGHDSNPGFDGLWAASAPMLQDDYAWRSNHVITLAAKAITIRYYGRPIQHSYMAGCSKGGHAVLMEAQRFPEDFDGLMAIAPVYDFTDGGRSRQHGSRRRSATAKEDLYSIKRQPMPCIDRYWRHAALKPALKLA